MLHFYAEIAVFRFKHPDKTCVNLLMSIKQHVLLQCTDGFKNYSLEIIIYIYNNVASYILLGNTRSFVNF